MSIDFNEEEKKQYDLDDLSERLAAHAPAWVPEYYPRGRISNDGKELRLANIRGAPPRKEGSCVIHLKGEKAGSWYDHSDADGGQALSTLAQATGLRGRDLLERAAEIVGNRPAVSVTPPARTEEDKARRITFILSGCVEPNGTPVETYLQSRGLSLPVDNVDLLYSPDLTDWEAKRGRPAMVAIIRDPVTAQRTGGIHRTYLTDDGTAKADMPKPKMMLGPAKGVVMLMPPSADGVIGIGEGIETTLAASKIFGVPAWAALSTGNMVNLPFPPWLKTLLVFADRGEGGESVAAALVERAKAAGIDGRMLLPRSDDDFATDLALGLWDEDVVALPPAPLIQLLAEPDEMVLPPNPSVADLVAAAARLTTGSKDISVVLRAACVLDPMSQETVKKAVKKATGNGLAGLAVAMREYRREEMPKIKMPVAWVGKMATYPDGDPKKILSNASTALREDPAWQGVLGFNEFADRIEVLRPLPFDGLPGGDFPQPWGEIQDLRLTEWLQKRGLHVPRELVSQAVPLVARDNSYNPCREWLSDLHWDGNSRIDFWLQGYLGVDDGMYARAVGSRYLISAVARVFDPGCKVDCALVLEGKQGVGKSSALKILFDPWFTDQISEMGSKDTAMQLHGVWGIELAELDAMDRVEVRRIKAFITQANDRYRPPYERHLCDIPRQCVFCGTINDSQYLRDPTGGRRFWPVKCNGNIDLGGLASVKEQLWAEAVARYGVGEPWFLHEPELIALADEQQSDRYEGDVWDDEIIQYLNSRFPPNVWNNGPDEISMSELLSSALNIEKSRWSVPDGHRVGKIMRHLGWEKIVKRAPGNKKMMQKLWVRTRDQ